MSTGLVVWFTGLSGSGKSTIALETEELLVEQSLSVDVIDGDEFRKRVGGHLGFSDADIAESNRLAIEACRKSQSSHDVVLVPRIAPSISGRSDAREAFGKSFVETYVSADLKTIETRDPKGLYARFRSGEGTAPIGLPGGASFEPPTHPEVMLDTDSMDQHALAQTLADFICSRISKCAARR